MDMPVQDIPRSQIPRRRRRSKLQIFKEAYLPTIILAVTIVLIIVFIIGAAVNTDAPVETTPSTTESTSATNTIPPTQETEPTIPIALREEAASRLADAQHFAADYDYDSALSVLEGFSGNRDDFPALSAAYQEYTAAKASMVSWKAGDVYNLSFQMLIADPQRAFHDDTYGSAYKRNFITTAEFSAILQQLYDNGYILVSMDDFYYEEFNSSSGRYIFKETELQLPAGKKPIMLTETNANYYTYMTDSNGDGKPDAGADGFASRLCYDANGFYNELVNADGSISTGSYDLVPLLEDFIRENPDFSYRGARAIIAFSGYDGILGYRINASNLGATALQAERDGAAAIVKALKDAGYHLACYTYDNTDYGIGAPTQVYNDIQKWMENIAPWIDALDTIVFAQNADIAGSESYTGNSKFNVLYNAGFRYFIGTSTAPWNQVDNQYIRHNKFNVTGYNLLNNPQLYKDLFDAASVKDSART